MKVGDLVRAINQPYDDYIPEGWVGLIVQVSGVLDHNLEPRDVAVYWNYELCCQPHDLFGMDAWTGDRFRLLEVISEAR